MNDDLFPFYGCWQGPFQSLSTGLKKMIPNRELDPEELAAVEKLIYAVDRLPNPTDGIAIEASISLTDELGRSSLDFSHSGDSIRLGYSRSFFELQGTEHESRDVLEAEVGVGNSCEEDDPITVMIELEDWVTKWSDRLCNPEYEFEIYDDLEVDDWDQPSHPEAWNALPDGV